MISIKRFFRHLLTTRRQLGRTFPIATLFAIEQEIKACEAAHVGEIRFAVESALPSPMLYHDHSARARAIDVFSRLRMWDTDHRNGVLIYLLLADRSVEIVADRGVHAKTDSPEWERICRGMESAFRNERYAEGAINGIREISLLLARHFPASGASRNQLSDKVVVL